MNKRQHKKRQKYDRLQKECYSLTHVRPTNWSEIRWMLQYVKREGR